MEALALVGMDLKATGVPGRTLSGGEHVARWGLPAPWHQKPRLMLWDEPTASPFDLDPGGRGPWG